MSRALPRAYSKVATSDASESRLNRNPDGSLACGISARSAGGYALPISLSSEVTRVALATTASFCTFRSSRNWPCSRGICTPPPRRLSSMTKDSPSPGRVMSGGRITQSMPSISRDLTVLYNLTVCSMEAKKGSAWRSMKSRGLTRSWPSQTLSSVRWYVRGMEFIATTMIGRWSKGISLIHFTDPSNRMALLTTN